MRRGMRLSLLNSSICVLLRISSRQMLASPVRAPQCQICERGRMFCTFFALCADISRVYLRVV